MKDKQKYKNKNIQTNKNLQTKWNTRTDAARIIKLDIEMFHRELGKPFILGSNMKGQGHEAQKRCRRGVFVCWLLVIFCAITFLLPKALSRTSVKEHSLNFCMYSVALAQVEKPLC